MPRKQAIANESSAAAAPARAANPKAPRVKSAKHTKAAAPDSAAVPEINQGTPEQIETTVFVSASAPAATSSVDADPREEIARIAYGYWQARGYTGGDPIDDWVRAENEYRSRLG